MTAVDPRLAVLGDPGAPRPARPTVATLKAYVSLTKPRIIELLLVTTLPTMMLATSGLPPVALMLTTLLGGTLAAGSANVLNCYLDRDIDLLMRRTKRRASATGVLPPHRVLVFGLVLGVVAVAELALAVNLMAAGLALAAILLYVVGYTMILKRRTPQNIVWGGSAGCMPVLIGWAAVRGRLDWAPVVLFLVIFFWTPPHYWPLSMRFRDDYAAAGVPMLPVVANDRVVARRVVAYSWAMVAASLALWPVAHTGPVYAGAALLLGIGFLFEAHRLQRRSRADVAAAMAPMRLFHASISYLTLLFAALAVDALLPF